MIASVTAYEKDESNTDEQRLRNIFNKLDVDKDGKIDIHDLSSALASLQVPQVPGQAQKLLDEYDKDKDGKLDFADLVRYIEEHEKKLRISFAEVDHNKDGVIDASEIMISFQKLGVTIDKQEANNLLRRMDKDETLLVNWEEWREYLLFHPYSDIQDIMHYWRHATILDVGEDVCIPDDFTEIEMRTGRWWRHLVAGAVAGSVSRTFTAPLDRLKVLLQVHGSSTNKLGIITGFKHMLNEGGTKSLWRGNGINVIKIAPESAIKFAAYEHIKRNIKGDSKRELQVHERFVAGSLAGAISQSVIYPMEVLKTRLALRSTGQYSGIIDCAKCIMAKEGAKNFYRGYVPNLIGIIPYAGIDLAVYETVKRFYIRRQTHDRDPGVMVLLVCGATSSTCGQLASYPLALVRTRLQARVHAGSSDSMVGLFREILKTEGPVGLYRGLAPNFMKVIPAVSISYVVFEHVRKFLGVEMS